jgi:hypothetical protein
MRTEFGARRSECGCEICVNNCRNMPGFLIPADLDRMIPVTADPFRWAESNLLASPGALAMKDGVKFRIHTLVPAIKLDGSCIYLDTDGRCQIHAVAPFGCAFFSCKGEAAPRLSHAGLRAVMADGDGLYSRLWDHLDRLGKRQLSPETLRRRMGEPIPK